MTHEHTESKLIKTQPIQRIQRISFLDTGKEFEVITQGDFRGVALKPIVEDMGLDWSSQAKKIKADEVLADSVVFSTIETERGSRESLFMDIKMIPWYLGTIHQDRVRPDLRDRVVQYKRYAAQVLFDATFGKLEAQAKLLEAQTQALEAEVQSLRQNNQSLQSLKVQYEMFDNVEVLPPQDKVRGLLSAYSRQGVSMAVICRHLKDETGFDPYPIQQSIRDMGGCATLLSIIAAHGWAEHAYNILCRCILPLRVPQLQGPCSNRR